MGEQLIMDTHNREEDNTDQTISAHNDNTEKENMLPMKKELSKKELKLEERERLKDIKENLTLTKDIQCGIGFLKGKFLQAFATQEIFVVLYGILGAILNAASSYYSGQLSTLEKRFRIPSSNIGIILTGNDITGLLFSMLITYYAGRKHKPRWVAIGGLLVTTFCVGTMLPHLVYGTGSEALALTKEYEHIQVNSTSKVSTDLCDKDGAGCITEGSLAPQAMFFISQFLWGIGSPLYTNLGMAYMDDNIKRSRTPVLMSFSFFIRMLGPVGGYALASWCLSKYIAPTLHPTITQKDPRWIGAWWLGWIVIAILMGFFSFLVSLFPKELPERAIRKILEEENKDEITKKKEDEEEASQTSWKDLKITFRRLLKNKILMCITGNSCLYCLGYYPFWTYMPKYMEIQYRVSASRASLITGVVGLVFTALGILISGGLISKLKPRARSLAAFNIFAGVVSMCGIISYMFLGCAEGDAFNLTVMKANEAFMSNPCNADCNCEFARYAPVCSMDGTNTTYISPCHAGCRSSTTVNNTKIYHDCSCVNPGLTYPHSIPEYKSNFTSDGILGGSASVLGAAGRIKGGSATMGSCAIDCNYQFYTFLAVVCLLKFMGASSKAGNVLVAVRCVDERDKAVSMSFQMTVLSLFAFIPAPVLFGWIMDQTCILWGKTCTGTGSCYVYDAANLRFYLNMTSMTLLAIANIFDVAVWYFVKDIQIFDEEVGKDKEKKEEAKTQNNERKPEYSPVKQSAG